MNQIIKISTSTLLLKKNPLFSYFLYKINDQIKSPMLSALKSLTLRPKKHANQTVLKARHFGLPRRYDNEVEPVSAAGMSFRAPTEMDFRIHLAEGLFQLFS